MKKKVPRAAPEIRRVPTQERSRKRLEAILDAAAELFADIGYDATTTEAIAAKAGTSIGSVYQFFPDKRALYRALAERCLERARAGMTALMSASGAGTRPWTEVVDAVLDGFFLFQAGDSTIRAVWRNWHLYKEFEEADEAVHRELVKRADKMLEPYARHLPAARRRALSEMVVEVSSAMVFLAVRSSGARGRKLVDETKLIVRRYLAPELDAKSGA